MSNVENLLFQLRGPVAASHPGLHGKRQIGLSRLVYLLHAHHQIPPSHQLLQQFFHLLHHWILLQNHPVQYDGLQKLKTRFTCHPDTSKIQDNHGAQRSQNLTKFRFFFLSLGNFFSKSSFLLLCDTHLKNECRVLF